MHRTTAAALALYSAAVIVGIFNQGTAFLLATLATAILAAAYRAGVSDL